ncbi:MAG: TIGR03088 family PEP-CTERM/XrtA system glycosyltransferase [Burkholderiales bacterium]|nr:TIGR03088 family PEP-CTERM/XrtA system glycosyltransferase [Burkholderiales bacterium]
MEPAIPQSDVLTQSTAADRRPLVLHIVYRFDVGGLENGVVNLINEMPAGAYRHAVLALTEATDFRHRIRRDDVPVIALHKPPGHGFWLYPTLFRLMRQWHPAIVHTRNLAALEAVVPAWAAGVPVRIHGEHGRDVDDLDGNSRKHQWLRRLYRPFVNHQVALGGELADYLVAKVGVARAGVTRICNGVDTARFKPAEGGAPAAIDGCPFDGSRHWLVGTVGRMQAVKDQCTLARAFVLALQLQPALRERMRLVMVGDGPLRAESLKILQAAGVADLAWLPGERHDVADVLRGLNCFVLPSLAEGVSNTILEAMASGLPVVATAVGANAELVGHGETGEIVPPADAPALAASIVRLALQPERAAATGRAGRAAALAKFSLPAMVGAYQSLYDSQLRARGRVAHLQERRS